VAQLQREEHHRSNFMRHHQGALPAQLFLQAIHLDDMPVQPTTMPRPMPPVVVPTSSKIRPPSTMARAMPSQQVGFLRAALLVAGVCSAAAPWQEVKVLVDSGSQQEPLMSQDLARRLGLRGVLSATAAQANGQPLPIYSVGPVQMAVNGAPSTEDFFAAPIQPYDVILGESWLLKHRGVLDYASGELYARDAADSRQPLVLNCRPGAV